MLDQRPRAGCGVEVCWGPRAIAEVSACRSDADARTAITLVVPGSAGPSLPTYRDMVVLKEMGVVAVDAPDDVDFADPDGALATAAFLCLLRDCTGLDVPVLWGGTGAGVRTVDALGHLSPPSRHLSGAPGDLVGAWRRSFRPGRFSWRRGPGFVVVEDWRRAGPGRRIVIGDRHLLDAFEQLAAPVRESATPSIGSGALRHLAAGDLTVQVGPWLLLAPHRMRP
jgi:hypothetical protein